MNKRYFLLIVVVIAFLSCSVISFVERAHALEEDGLAKLVKKIGATNNSELLALSFFELNILKNSIYSAKGYQYAGDRGWLDDYFYNPFHAQRDVKDDDKSKTKWDLSEYSFPEPQKDVVFQIDKDMEKAITNVRVALFKKVKSYKSLTDVDIEIKHEIASYQQEKNQFIFGRKISYISEFGDSIRREAHGYKCLMNLIDSDQSFDACELLGIYVGSVVLFKNILEAKNGKIFSGVSGWEISQIVGVTPQDTQYDPQKLPQKVKQKIQVLNSIIQKMTRSGIGDVPKDLKDSTENLSIQYYEGC
jgi:hypothetical protein